ncbi:YnfA family protein [Permianibacter sp. IMCC34836]|uniref:YnfA family protein n=1 Tax=Permianibacter fluminis TaxID=2738515 RepID=UPI00155271D5|nr:YnfA family protein [Permianibacter fluminis]NQD37934.1 YnfA family protein [Permianibacter fluminis]
MYALKAVTEVGGCYLVWLWLKQNRSGWLLLPAALSLAFFAGLLTLHPVATGRVYAAHGGVYVAAVLAWLWAVDAVLPDCWDVLGSVVAVLGMAIIAFAPRGN